MEAVLELEIEAEKVHELMNRAQAAYRQAYIPYSHYPVGAAVLFASGEIYSGCNVENVSYGLTVCAERNAIFQAVARGERELKGIAIAVPTDEFPSPCGACRQVIREFAVDCPVILINGQGQTKKTSLKVLLPDAFVGLV
ncbi:cytidine deaminase [Desulfosporosinus sp. Sb-LF]|uniref:cytidine deaminase n=1 Tax=Desulfosporosinus sp. Sb-LF TaxID=2560027 RepID=UPI00107F2B76|nr:cytidine deaminase [Desulfosporosinus sp. Sb-LF]TGE32801.1 cytidine deaminase [Desulfosporosinus sp. Sb-LF]